jgi:hypothetical protein
MCRLSVCDWFLTERAEVLPPIPDNIKEKRTKWAVFVQVRFTDGFTVIAAEDGERLAHELDLALEEDLPWNQWFHSG